MFIRLFASILFSCLKLDSAVQMMKPANLSHSQTNMQEARREREKITETVSISHEIKCCFE